MDNKWTASLISLLLHLRAALETPGGTTYLVNSRAGWRFVLFSPFVHLKLGICVIFEMLTAPINDIIKLLTTNIDPSDIPTPQS